MRGTNKPLERRGLFGDPVPEAIRILGALRYASTTAPAADVARAYAQVDRILAAWHDREDPAELAEALGLARVSKRRKNLTAQSDIRLAMLWISRVAQLEDGTSAKAAVADQKSVEIRTVERAIAGCRSMLEGLIDDPEFGDLEPLTAADIRAIEQQRRVLASDISMAEKLAALESIPPLQRRCIPWPKSVRDHVRAQLPKSRSE